MARGVSFFSGLVFRRSDQFISLSPSNHFLAKLTVVPSAGIVLGSEGARGEEGTNKLTEGMRVGRHGI